MVGWTQFLFFVFIFARRTRDIQLVSDATKYDGEKTGLKLNTFEHVYTRDEKCQVQNDRNLRSGGQSYKIKFV